MTTSLGKWKWALNTLWAMHHIELCLIYEWLMHDIQMLMTTELYSFGEVRFELRFHNTGNSANSAFGRCPKHTYIIFVNCIRPMIPLKRIDELWLGITWSRLPQIDWFLKWLFYCALERFAPTWVLKRFSFGQPTLGVV